MKLNKKYLRNSGFTLLELMAVMLIMFMLMGMGTVAMKGLIQGSGISGAYSNIKGVLTQARQYAITKEQRVYVIFDKSADEEKNSMIVCAKYGVCEGNGFADSGDYSGKYSVILEDPLPWGTNSLVDAIVYNLDRTTNNKGELFDNTFVAGGYSKIVAYNDANHPRITWGRGDGVGFEVADIRYLPSGMKFNDTTGDLIVIFNPDGSAGSGSGTYNIIFKEMYIAGADDHELEVDKLTGWVSTP